MSTNDEITRYDLGEDGMDIRRDGGFVAWDDYVALRELFEKYIAHVGYQEGVDFIESSFRSPFITSKEWTELERLSETSRRF